MSGTDQVRAHARRLGVDLTSVGLAAVVAYLGAHAVTGRQGVASMMDLADREARLTHELADLQARRAALADEVARLNDKSLDLDLVEERARRLIDAAGPDEIVLPVPKG